MADEVEKTPAEDEGLATRALRAGRVIVASQVAVARREAREDLGRVGTGLALLAAAVLLVAAAATLLQAAAVMLLQARFGLSFPAALAAVAAADVVLALVLGLVARAKLSPPVMVETRALMKRAAAVLRGAS